MDEPGVAHPDEEPSPIARRGEKRSPDLDAVAAAVHRFAEPPSDVAAELHASRFVGSYRVRTARRTPHGVVAILDLPPLLARRFRSSDESDEDPIEIGVNAYLDTDDEDVAVQVFVALDAVAEALGYQRMSSVDIVSGSIWLRAVSRVRQVMTSRRFRLRLDAVERALELAALDERQADVDVKTADAAAQLVKSLEGIPQACLRVGSIFLIKFPDGAGGHCVFVRTLSQTEIRTLERFPEIQTNPRKALEALATAIDAQPAAGHGTAGVA